MHDASCNMRSPSHADSTALKCRVSLGFSSLLKPFNAEITIEGNASVSPKSRISMFFAELAKNCKSIRIIDTENNVIRKRMGVITWGKIRRKLLTSWSFCCLATVSSADLPKPILNSLVFLEEKKKCRNTIEVDERDWAGNVVDNAKTPFLNKRGHSFPFANESS